MAAFPYSEAQIRAAVEAEKHPRDWASLDFEKSGDNSRRLDVALEREDGRDDRLRLVIRAGRLDDPTSYKASLLLEDVRIRGIDHHAVERRQFYKEVSPRGWHEDVVDPNRSQGEKGHHRRDALPDFNPTDLADFVKNVAKRWHITLPPSDETLL